MKIVFFGTPEFAIPTLKILHESNHDVIAVVTAPDKKRGRGRKVSVTPVKQFALENKIPVLTPQKLKSPEFEEELKSFNADLFVILAFRILPENIFSIPPKGSFNLHGSLLPKYRGAAPIQWAIINGERETGITTFFLKKKVDTGNIILSRKIEIEDSDNLGSLHDKMSLIGAELVLETVNLIESGEYKLTEQNNELATPAPKITKETCLINWNKSAEEIHNLIRGLSPYPAAFFFHNNKQYKVFASKITDRNNLQPSEIRETKTEIFIGTLTQTLQILEIQPEGRKRMDAESFLRGYSLI